MRTHDRLTYNLFDNFGDRKETGRVSTLTDLETGLIHIVPREIEHINFAYGILNADEIEVERLAKLIPTHVGIERLAEDGLQVISLLSGICGLEIGLRVRHTRAQLQEGHERIREFVANGEIPVLRPLREDKILYKYASD